ncbi:secreted protein [Melampsora americana]|nr:secreted protein [Melampsora americana]
MTMNLRMKISTSRWYRKIFFLMITFGSFAIHLISLSEVIKRQGPSAPRFESSISSHPIPAGPHGTLNLPEGGKLIKSVGQMGVLYVDYSKCDEDEATTISIDIILRPTEENDGYSITLARGVTSPSDEPNIVALFSSHLACGSYRLVIRENQFYKGEFFSFQSAAPLIHFHCIPIE